MKTPSSAMEASFLDTPRGIFTASGVWFRTTESSLRQYAGPLLEHEPIERLMAMAERWLRSPGTLALWVFPIAGWFLGLWPALLIACGVYVLLAIWCPVFVSYGAYPFLKILDHVASQAGLYIVAMSFFAMMERFDLMAAGLILFILMRWGLIGKAFDILLKYVHRVFYEIPYPDQVLKSIILRGAMKHHVSMPELDRIEKTIMKQIHRK